MLTDASVEFIALVAQPGDILLDGRVSVSKTEAALGRSGPGELLALSPEIRAGDRLEPYVERFRPFRARPAWTPTKSGGSDQKKRKRHRLTGRSKVRPVGATSGVVLPLYAGQPALSVGYLTNRL
jgi:hypothetical protein